MPTPYAPGTMGVMRWLVIVLLSGVLGVAAAAADVLAAGRFPDARWRAVELVLNAGSVWAGLAVVSGWLARRPVAGAVAAIGGLAIAVVAYYAYAMLLGIRVGAGLTVVGGRIELWLVAAAIFGPALGVAGALSRRTDGLGLLAAWVLPAGIIGEILLYRGLHWTDLTSHPGEFGGELALLVFGGALAGAALLRWIVVRARPRQPTAVRVAATV